MPDRPERAAARFAHRMLPIALVIGIGAAALPPAVVGVRGSGELRAQGASLAGTLAHALEAVAVRQPELWPYNVPKLLQVTAGHRQVDAIGLVRVTDCGGAALIDGAALQIGSGSGGGPSAWAPVRVGAEAVGWVHVVTDIAPLERRVASVAAASGAFGLALGLLVFLFPTRAFRSQARELAGAMRQLALAEAELRQANLSLQERVSVAVAHVRTLSAELVRAQEDERRRIARDLHDSVGQLLTALQIELDLAAQKGGDPSGHLALARDLCEQALSYLRRIVRDLRPPELETAAPSEVYRALLDRFEQRTGITASFRHEGGEIESEDAAVCFLRVLQEALTNVGRHAGAEEVGVTLRAGLDTVTLEITDDGAGFEPAAPSAGHGLGNMAERVRLLGGKWTLESAPGEGTRIRAELPARLGASPS
jgi:signal transduction histidine kinase